MSKYRAVSYFGVDLINAGHRHVFTHFVADDRKIPSHTVTHKCYCKRYTKPDRADVYFVPRFQMEHTINYSCYYRVVLQYAFAMYSDVFKDKKTVSLREKYRQEKEELSILERLKKFFGKTD